MRIAIYKYGVGNIHSVASALRALGAQPMVLEEPGEGIGEYDALILPGVGNYGAAVRRLQGTRDTIVDYVRSGGSVLGICLGMQLLYEESEEAPGRGLGLLQGRVVRLDAPKLPHIGWTRVYKEGESRLLEGVGQGEYFYFVHSYAVTRPGPEARAYAEYEGNRFAALVEKPPIYGTQFHPERSGPPGRRVLKNFIKELKA